ncbi:hypothetical protein ACHQM5_029335 [Ranunculus cassubicifolius]
MSSNAEKMFQIRCENHGDESRYTVAYVLQPAYVEGDSDDDDDGGYDYAPAA